MHKSKEIGLKESKNICLIFQGQSLLGIHLNLYSVLQFSLILITFLMLLKVDLYLLCKIKSLVY
jgi:hypothetical protein